MPVSWTAENERKFVLRIIYLVNTKDIDVKEIATHFPGATPRAIYEHLKILRKEAKALVDGAAPATTAPAMLPAGKAGEDEDGNSKRGRKRKADVDVDVEGEGAGDEDMAGAMGVKKKKGNGNGKEVKGKGKVKVKVETESDGDGEGDDGDGDDDA